MMRTTALSLIWKSKAWDAWSGQDRGDSAGPLSEQPFDQGDQPGFGRVLSNDSEGFALGRDGARLQASDAAAAEERALPQCRIWQSCCLMSS